MSAEQTGKELASAEALRTALLDGSRDPAVAEGVARQCVLDGASLATISEVLLATERRLHSEVRNGLPSRVALATADRLRAALGALLTMDLGSGELLGAKTQKLGTIAVASLPGDARDVGRYLWSFLLRAEGYAISDLGKCAPALVVQRVGEAQPHALAVFLVDRRGRQAAQALLTGLLRGAVNVPVLLGGPGFDQAFAQWVAIPSGGELYWPGVYYCDDAREAVEVMRQVILRTPDARTHDHGVQGSGSSDGGSSCCRCPLEGGCQPDPTPFA